VASGNFAGLYEAAVNIRSDQGTEVLFTEKLEDLKTEDIPKANFTSEVKLAYGTGSSNAGGVDYMGLSNGEFNAIENDELYDKIGKLTQGCDALGVYGVTYSPTGNGIHDVHMNSGTEPGDSHAGDDRKDEDGAIVFYFDLGAGKAFAHWVFIRFSSQTVVDS
jgi:hypothetical protein